MQGGLRRIAVALVQCKRFMVDDCDEQLLACACFAAWSRRLLTVCLEIFCSATVLDNANWPVIAAGSNAVEGTCQDGYSGPTSRNCDLNGNWTPVSVACTRTYLAVFMLD